MLRSPAKQAVDLDVDKLDKNIDRMMPELGFSPEDNDRLVASYSGGWQMRMCLGKILLQQPDLLLLDEPTNHLDLNTIQWLEGALFHCVPAVCPSSDIPTLPISMSRGTMKPTSLAWMPLCEPQ